MSGYRVALVCEGPTDQAIVEAVLDHYLALGDYETLLIQPPISALGGDSGDLGGGWKGVRAWCQQEGSLGSGLSSVQGNSDILVIQVDADVAAEEEIGRAKKCPPPAESANEIRELILEWLAMDDVPGSTVFCVPSMASETWALVALFPDDDSVVPCLTPPVSGECVECRTDIKALLWDLGRDLPQKLVVRKDGALKNRSKGYRAKQGSISKAWPDVVNVCGEADRFDKELRALLP